MKNLIKEYLKLCIDSKKSLRKEIKRLDAVTKQLYEVTAAQQELFDEYSKTSYKKKFNNEHKKAKTLEQENNNMKILLQKYKPEIYNKGVNNEEGNNKQDS